MIEIKLTASNPEQECLKRYLEENASEVLAEKINEGVKIEKDGKTLINKKTLDSFLKYANEKAKKQALKGSNFAFVENKVVYGWLMHYFEEESIEGTLYNEDGTQYSKPIKTKSPVVTTVPKPIEPPKPKSSQLSLFDFSSEEATEPTEKPEEEKEVETDEKQDVEEEIQYDEVEEMKETEIVEDEPKISPLYEKYLALTDKYPTTIVALRVGDFYEIFDAAAERVAKELELTLTSRDFGLDERTAMVGFPFHREEVYREKIREFSSLAVAESEDNVKFYLIKQKDGQKYKVDTSTGEVIEERNPAVDDLIGILFGILKNDVEDKR